MNKPDIPKEEQAGLTVVHLATIDELTGISNRQGFMFLAQHSLNLCARQNIPITLINLDLHNFKHINDAFGHDEGNRALISFAAQMKSIFRESDVFARLEGYEFAALLTNTSKHRAKDFLARFSQSLKLYNQAAGQEYDIEFSHGIVEYNPVKHATLAALLAEGDVLMHAEKGGQ